MIKLDHTNKQKQYNSQGSTKMPSRLCGVENVYIETFIANLNLVEFFIYKNKRYIYKTRPSQSVV